MRQSSSVRVRIRSMELCRALAHHQDRPPGISEALRNISGALPSPLVIVLESDMLCSSLSDRRQKQLTSTLSRMFCLPPTSPLRLRITDDSEIRRLAFQQSSSRSFLTCSDAAHRYLYNEEPQHRNSVTFPPRTAPWGPHYLPSKSRPNTPLTISNK